MIEVAITQKGQERKIRLDGPTGKDQMEYSKILKNLADKPLIEQGSYYEFRHDLIVKLSKDGPTPLTKEEVQELDLEEIEKIMQPVEDRLLMKEEWLRPFLQRLKKSEKS